MSNISTTSKPTKNNKFKISRRQKKRRIKQSSPKPKKSRTRLTPDKGSNFVNDFDDPAIPLDVLESTSWGNRRKQETTDTTVTEAISDDPPTGNSKQRAANNSATSSFNPSSQQTKSTKPPRDLAFDNIRAVLIFLVIFGHAIEYFRLTNQMAEFVYVFIYFFHMPVFIFISGYFSKNLIRGRATAVRNFLLPYLLLNIVLSIIMFALGKIDEILILNPGWTLWYLYCMFIWRLLLPDLVRIRYIMLVSFIVAIFSGFLTEFGTYMAMARTLGFLPFFLAGYFFKDAWLKKIRNFPFRRLLALLVAILGLVTATIWIKGDLPPEILWGDRAYDLLEIPLWQSLLADIYLYALSFAFIFAFLTLAKNRQRFYTIWGQNTLAIYLLHVYLVAPLVDFGERLAAYGPWWQMSWLLLGSVVILWLLSRPIVSRGVAKVLDKVNTFLMKAD